MPTLPSMPSSKAQMTTGQSAPSSIQFARSGGASFCGVGKLVTFSNSTTAALLTSQSARRSISQQSQQKAQSGESIDKSEDVSNFVTIFGPFPAHVFSNSTPPSTRRVMYSS